MVHTYCAVVRGRGIALCTSPGGPTPETWLRRAVVLTCYIREGGHRKVDIRHEGSREESERDERKFRHEGRGNSSKQQPQVNKNS